MKNFILASLILFATSFFWSSEKFAMEVKPFDLPTKETLQLIEGYEFCFAGYGAGQNILNLGDNRKSELYKGSFYNGLNLSIGCEWKLYFLDFSLVELSHLSDNNFISKGKKYNIAELLHENVFTGYSVAIWPHWIYLDLGVGHGITRFQYFYRDKSLNYSDEEKMSESWFYKIGIKLFLNRQIMLEWKTLEAFKKSEILQSSQVLNINLYTRF